ncbi:hypothetical protein L6164_007389 [Bauhinia variegata]|uniref:Uncharacterized protein n=1 Tax=Bauhinia variegata TaxID=167791 RepID=A0ACB9PCE7_BAUVA|nr:hypothetical protein L6164_007389 [Bauhinia variegata]
MEWRHCYKDVVPFAAMVTVQCTNVGVNILFKAATEKGLSYYVFIVYTYAISTIVLLLPLPFICRSSIGLPSIKAPLICRILLLGVIGFGALLSGYKGLDFSSATLASAISNLVPAFTFILAIVLRMEKVALRSLSTQAKIIGTIVSISDELDSGRLPPGSRVSSMFNLVYRAGQADTVKIYPAELIVVFLYNLCGTMISAPVCFLAESNLSAWRLNPDITLVTVICAGIFSNGFVTVVDTWVIRLKGPVYVSMFRPLSIAIAAAMSVIFLGDALHLGSVVGAAILSTGFYAVIWGKAKEEDELSGDNGINYSRTPSYRTPLLQNSQVEDSRGAVTA